MPAAYAKALAAEAAARGLPVTLGVPIESLDDETQPVALSTYLAALRSVGPAVAEAAQLRLLEPEQLAVWSRLLRRAHDVAEAYELLGSEEALGSASFHVLQHLPHGVRGQLEVRHDPRLEEDPALLRARMGMLAVVPRLFGLRGVRVAAKGRELTITWRSEEASRVLGVLVGLGTGAVLAALRLDGLTLGLGFVAVLLGGVALPWWQAKVLVNGRVGRAQRIRGAVMERQLVLAEEARPARLGDFAGTLVAGLYRIERRMGTGASGVVYRAARITDELPVAIKLLRAATAHDVVASDRLRREAEALGLSWHPNVVEVLDHGMLPDGTSYMVMEALEGESLAERLERGPLSVADTLRLGVELAAALVAVHAAGVIHRDVKPDNVFLLETDAGAMRVKLLDFGIAKVEWEELRITHSGGPIGTTGYMAPEQERGDETDARADVYSLGAVLGACLAGSSEPRPPALARLLVRAVAAAPEARPSARELGAELQALCSPAAAQATLET